MSFYDNLTPENATRMYFGAGEAIRMINREIETVKNHGVSLGVDKQYYLDELAQMRDNLIKNGNGALTKLTRTPGYNTENMKKLK